MSTPDPGLAARIASAPLLGDRGDREPGRTAAQVLDSLVWRLAEVTPALKSMTEPRERAQAAEETSNLLRNVAAVVSSVAFYCGDGEHARMLHAAACGVDMAANDADTAASIMAGLDPDENRNEDVPPWTAPELLPEAVEIIAYGMAFDRYRAGEAPAGDAEASDAVRSALGEIARLRSSGQARDRHFGPGPDGRMPHAACPDRECLFTEDLRHGPVLARAAERTAGEVRDAHFNEVPLPGHLPAQDSHAGSRECAEGRCPWPDPEPRGGARRELPPSLAAAIALRRAWTLPAGTRRALTAGKAAVPSPQRPPGAGLR